MPVKISSGDGKLSNKPQPFPKPKPPYELFPTVLCMQDGRIVRIAVPVVDRLSLIVDITPDIFGATAPKDLTVAEWGKQVRFWLLSQPNNTQVLKTGYTNADGWLKFVTMGMGERNSSVRFEFSAPTKKAPARMRLEFNPRKLLPLGIKTLLKCLNDPLGPFNGKALLKSARVTRMDIAIDIEGVQTSQIVAWHKSQVQRSMYIGHDGLLETVYLHAKPIKAKPAGTVMLSIYDRSRERIKKNKPPPFGPSPVTRIEITKKFKAPNNGLGKLLTLADPFGSVRVGYLPEQGVGPHNWWTQYVGLRRTMPHAEACKLLGLSNATSEQFDKAYQVPNPNLVSKGQNWNGWKHGLEYTGLILLLNAAI